MKKKRNNSKTKRQDYGVYKLQESLILLNLGPRTINKFRKSKKHNSLFVNN